MVDPGEDWGPKGPRAEAGNRRKLGIVLGTVTASAVIVKGKVGRNPLQPASSTCGGQLSLKGVLVSVRRLFAKIRADALYERAPCLIRAEAGCAAFCWTWEAAQGEAHFINSRVEARTALKDRRMG